MKQFSLPVETMLSVCQRVVGVIDNQQTMAILSHVVIRVQSNVLTALSSDSQIELKASISVDLPGVDITFAVPGRKFVDICKALSKESQLRLIISDNQVVMKSGKSQFRLSCLSAGDFPTFDSFPPVTSFQIKESDFYHLLRRTSFAMAVTDVRYYLNGLLLETHQNNLSVVATDGHRLAIAKHALNSSFSHKIQSLIPRKTALEAFKLLDKNSDKMLNINLGNHLMSLESEGLYMVSKLIDGRFPDYEQAVPKYTKEPLIFDRPKLKNALQRIAILSNEKIGGVLFNIQEDGIKITSTDSDLGDAEEDLPVHSSGIGEASVGVNVNYFLDVLGLIESDMARLFYDGIDKSILVEADNEEDRLATYLIMPLRI